MILTPLDVQQKTFGTALRGYDLDEVDRFLDDVVKTLKDYEDRLKANETRMGDLAAELASHTETQAQISRSLLNAERTADLVIAEATSEGERIVEAARKSADEVSASRDLERSRLQMEVDAIRSGITKLRTVLGSLVTSVDGELSEVERAVTRTESDFVDSDFSATEPVESEFDRVSWQESAPPIGDTQSNLVGSELYDQELDEGWDPGPINPGPTNSDPINPGPGDDTDESASESASESDGDDLRPADPDTGGIRSVDPVSLTDVEPSDAGPSDDPILPGDDDGGDGDDEQNDEQQPRSVPELPVRRPGLWNEDVERPRWSRPDLDEIEPYRSND